MGDFYIRQSADGETRGPFDEEQLVSLAQAAQITLATEVADESKSFWLAIQDFPEMKALLFPEKKKLGLKKEAKEEQIQYINQPAHELEPAMTVEQMIAVSKGQADAEEQMEEAHKKADRVAELAIPVLIAMMVVSGLANCLPQYRVMVDLFTQGKWGGLIDEPYALVGSIDLLLAAALLLHIFHSVHLVRFRAMLGMGCFLYYYWSQGDPVSMVAAVGAGIGLFICTVTLNLITLIGFAFGGMCSMAYLAWTVWSATHG